MIFCIFFLSGRYATTDKVLFFSGRKATTDKEKDLYI